MTDIRESAQNLAAAFPVWDENIWSALQQKRYPAAEQNLEELLRNFEPLDWDAVYWKGIFTGIPAVRGEISQGEWAGQGVPLIARALIRTASGKIISGVIRALEPAQIPSFFQTLSGQMDGGTPEEKMEWLKTHQSSLFLLLSAAPAQDFRMNPISYAGLFPAEKIVNKYRSLPPHLRDALFSYEHAESIFRLSQTNHFSDEKMSLLARLVGRVLLGFVHFEDFANELQNLIPVDIRITNSVAQEISQKIFAPLVSSIKSAYEPEIQSNASFPAAPALKYPPTAQPEASKKEQVGEGPLVLHTEKPMADEVKKGFRGFSFPLSFIKPRSAETPATPIARVETPLIKKDEPRTVHYSENRTPVSPFGQSSGEFINLETFEKFAAPANAAPGRTSPPPISIKPSTEMAPPPKETPVIIATPPAPTEKPTLSPEPKRTVWPTAPQAAAPQVATPQIVTPQVVEPKPATLEGGEPKLSGNTVDLR